MTQCSRRPRLWVLAAAFVVALGLMFPVAFSGSAHAQPPYPGGCDVNVDGSETITDALLVAQHVVGLTTLTGTGLTNADCNVDTNVTISDGLLIAQRVVGLV